jgi:hypothetical protein
MSRRIRADQVELTPKLGTLGFPIAYWFAERRKRRGGYNKFERDTGLYDGCYTRSCSF